MCPMWRKHHQETERTAHLLTHTGEKTHDCTECKNILFQKSQLILYHRTHTGEKPYKCNHCGKVFCQKSHPFGHQRLLKRKKTYVCAECKKAFFQKFHIAGNQQVTTGEKHYICAECGWPFLEVILCSKSQNSHRRETISMCSVWYLPHNNQNARCTEQRIFKDTRGKANWCIKADLSEWHPTLQQRL